MLPTNPITIEDHSVTLLHEAVIATSPARIEFMMREGSRTSSPLLVDHFVFSTTTKVSADAHGARKVFIIIRSGIALFVTSTIS